MQFVTGGAFNGKSSWVRAYNQMNGGSTSWISAYHQSLLPLSLDHLDENVVVIEGIEQWIKELLIEFEAEAVRGKWQAILEKCQIWESADQGRMVILIGSDITKGIVPIEAENRVWRDVTGRVYQDTVSICNRVDLIWYGINKRLK
jgi:adenosylcobinamide kinase / adenosylcobinamide-phosphate guanylyltransferase